MTTFERILSLNVNYLDGPREGEILGPQVHSSFNPLSQPNPKSQKEYARLRRTEQKLSAQVEEAQNEQRIMLELF
jgi:hypothetical protein